MKGISYVDKEAFKYAMEKVKEYVASNYSSKSDIEDISTILDEINGEVV